MRMYLALERLLNRHAECGPLSRIDFDARHVAKVRSTDSAAMVAELVAGLQPDVILMNAPQAWHVALTGIARGGCWRLGTDILDEHHAGLSLLRPVLAGSNVSTIDLRLADDVELECPPQSCTQTGR